jgi:hypothetical protein
MTTLASQIVRSRFLRGCGSVASFFPRSSRYALNLPVDLRSTTETLADDWRAVFGDLRTATAKVDRELAAARPVNEADRAAD